MNIRSLFDQKRALSFTKHSSAAKCCTFQSGAVDKIIKGESSDTQQQQLFGVSKSAYDQHYDAN